MTKFIADHVLVLKRLNQNKANLKLGVAAVPVTLVLAIIISAGFHSLILFLISVIVLIFIFRFLIRETVRHKHTRNFLSLEPSVTLEFLPNELKIHPALAPQLAQDDYLKIDYKNIEEVEIQNIIKNQTILSSWYVLHLRNNMLGKKKISIYRDELLPQQKQIHNLLTAQNIKLRLTNTFDTAYES